MADQTRGERRGQLAGTTSPTEGPVLDWSRVRTHLSFLQRYGYTMSEAEG